MGVALPLIPHNKKRPQSKQIKPFLRKTLRVVQCFLFSLNTLLVLLWALFTFFGILLIPIKPLIIIEVVKYLSMELVLLMLLWLFIGGRGYCYYCPAGTLLGLIGRGVGQRIETNLTHCTNCNVCNDACKMSNDIISAVNKNVPLKTIHCTGCGACIDSCPTHNLQYSTNFLSRMNPNSDKPD
jgi:polyferredoxin